MFHCAAGKQLLENADKHGQCASSMEGAVVHTLVGKSSGAVEWPVAVGVCPRQLSMRLV